MPESNIKVFPSLDGHCFFHLLMHLAYYDKEDPDAYQDALSEAIGCATEDGHTMEVIREICSLLKLNLVSPGQLDKLVTYNKVQHFVNKVVNQAPPFPAIMVYDRHCSLVTRKWAGKRFSIRDVANVFKHRRLRVEGIREAHEK